MRKGRRKTAARPIRKIAGRKAKLGAGRKARSRRNPAGRGTGLLGSPWTAKEAAISSAAPADGRSEPTFVEYYPEENVHFEAAKGLDETVHEYLKEKTVTARPAFAAVIPNGRVWGWDGAVLTSDYRLLSDVSMEFSWEYIIDHRHSIQRRWRTNPVLKVPGTVGVLTHPGGRNFYHWMFDIVPRIHLLRNSGVPIDKYVMMRNRSPYQNEILNLLNIPREQRIYTHKRFHLQAKKLVVPSLTSKFSWSPSHYPLPVVYARWACQAVRNQLLPHGNPPNEANERLYISRSMAIQRKMLNERDLLNLLQPLGFTVIHPETLSVRDQIGLFASAKTIVAPHGAALANLAFCRPGTQVIELCPPNYVPGYFWMLSRHFDLDYYCLLGDRHVFSSKPWQGGADFTVDLKRLAEVLEKAGIR
ncbi:glycosyltransferase family 61 protein [Cohnella caldifontis]|uniref:glycosyltransferase family 61 protein n=1 Tax=Cohnella caldifontis TaxID=3027471 RepID=UPI0023EC6B4C|nr:glycosyltransferase 61 family protein [Cohnella sp. YIM B05605]